LGRTALVTLRGKYKNLFTGKLATISCEALCNINIYIVGLGSQGGVVRTTI
jgi:hypothetical protein